jgi:hypothetical protein
MPSEPMRVPSPNAAFDGYGRVHGGIVREFQYLPGPFQKLEYLRYIRKAIDTLQHELGPALHAAASKERDNS